MFKRKMLPYGKQFIDREDLNEVIKTLRSNFLTQGPKIKEFEDAICRFTGAKYAVVVSNGTAALHLSCLVAGLKKHQEAITSPISFLATSNAVLYAGAKPVFADINFADINISIKEIQKKITNKTKVIIPVHFAGLPCVMDEIYNIAKKNNLIIIEDACHALGAEYLVNNKWIKIGSCIHSDMTIFSFHPVKHITTAEGGVITTNDEKLYHKLKKLRSHGVHKEDEVIKKHGLWYYEMRELGYNYRLSDLQAALGLSQIKKIENFLIKRKYIAQKYKEAFENYSPNISLQKTIFSKYKHAYHLFVLKIDFEYFKISRNKFILALRDKNISTQVHYIPIYKQPYYKNLGYIDKCVAAEKYYKKAISIPLFPSMEEADIEYVIKTIKELLKI